MAKMNLDFLLSPETGSGHGDRSSDRSNKPENSAFSLDYIAPRDCSNDDDKHRSLKHHRRSNDPAVHHSRSTQSARTPHSSSTKVHSSKDPSHSTSRSHFKSKKSKSPGSPSTMRPGSSSAEVKPHVCRSCDRSFYKLEQLKRHDRLVHLNLRPFLCTTCDLSFGTKQNMQVHLTTRKHRHRLETLQSNLHHSGHGSSSRQHR